MICPDWLIKLLIWLKQIKITPYESELVNPNSVDIRLGNIFNHVSGTLIDPLDSKSFITVSDIGKGDYYPLNPNQFLLGCLHEDISIPRYICAEIRGKSSLGRLGLDNSSCAGWVDAGWNGVLTIELHNRNDRAIKLTPGMKIGQMVFHLTLPCLTPYGKKKDSKYQNQPPGQGSKGI